MKLVWLECIGCSIIDCRLRRAQQPVQRVHKYTSTQIHKYTNTQVHKYRGTVVHTLHKVHTFRTVAPLFEEFSVHTCKFL